MARVNSDLTKIPRAKRVKTIGRNRIEVEFLNGEIRRFDLTPLLRFPVYQTLKDPRYFRKVFVNQGIVQWPDEEDIHPESLYFQSERIFSGLRSNE